MALAGDCEEQIPPLQPNVIGSRTLAHSAVRSPCTSATTILPALGFFANVPSLGSAFDKGKTGIDIRISNQRCKAAPELWLARCLPNVSLAGHGALLDAFPKVASVPTRAIANPAWRKTHTLTAERLNEELAQIA